MEKDRKNEGELSSCGDHGEGEGEGARNPSPFGSASKGRKVHAEGEENGGNDCQSRMCPTEI